MNLCLSEECLWAVFLTRTLVAKERYMPEKDSSIYLEREYPELREFINKVSYPLTKERLRKDVLDLLTLVISMTECAPQMVQCSVQRILDTTAAALKIGALKDSQVNWLLSNVICVVIVEWGFPFPEEHNKLSSQKKGVHNFL